MIAEGELPVDVLEISEITFLSSEQGDGDGVVKNPNPQNALAPPLAPSGKGGTWKKRADMLTARMDLSTSVVGGTFLSTVEAYDPTTDTWAKKADMPTGRASLAASAVNRYIYAIGGVNTAITDIVEEYDPAQSGFSVTPAGKRTTTWARMKSGK